MTRKRNGSSDAAETLIMLAGVGFVGYIAYSVWLAAQGVKKAANFGGDTFNTWWNAEKQAVDNIGGAVSNAVQTVTGAIIPGSLSTPGDFEIPGTGQTVSELVALGYTQAEISQLMADATRQYGAPLVAPAAKATTLFG